MGTTEPDEDQRASAGQVVVGLDGSPASRLALLVGARSALARAVALRAVVVEPPPLADGWSYTELSGPTVPSPESTERTRAMAAEELDAALDRVRHERGRAPEAEVVLRTGDPARTLLHLARDAAELVIGHHGHGLLASGVLGSVGMRAVLHAPCPVTVVRGTLDDDRRHGGRGARVVVGLDGSESSRAALRHALGEAVRRGSPLTALVVHRSEEIVWPNSMELLPMAQDLARIEVDRARAFVDETVADLRAQGDRLPEVEVIGRNGSPAAVLTDAARDADLLVVGHRGRGALRSVLLGSTALGCLLRARCAVAVVPPSSHAEPSPRATAASR